MRLLFFVAQVVMFSGLELDSLAVSPELFWEKLTPIPDAVGLAAPFAGVHHGALIVAGGANFPDKPPWQGGVKTWHRRLFVLDGLHGTWMKEFHLPFPRAYGVSLSTADGVLCIGGSDATRHVADVFLLQWDGRQISTNNLPPLPLPCANACGAIVGGKVYMAGGQQTPSSSEALHTFWSLDLANPTSWQPLPPWPGPARIFAVAAASDDHFYLFGGADLKPGPDGGVTRQRLQDAYQFTPATNTWRRLHDLPRPVVAAPSPAPVIQNRHVILLGGDDGSQIHVPPEQHAGFSRTPLIFDLVMETWSADSNPLPFSLVTTPSVIWGQHCVIPGGEQKPGIRSNAVWAAPLPRS